MPRTKVPLIAPTQFRHDGHHTSVRQTAVVNNTSPNTHGQRWRLRHSRHFSMPPWGNNKPWLSQADNTRQPGSTSAAHMTIARGHGTCQKQMPRSTIWRQWAPHILRLTKAVNMDPDTHSCGGCSAADSPVGQCGVTQVLAAPDGQLRAAQLSICSMMHDPYKRQVTMLAKSRCQEPRCHSSLQQNLDTMGITHPFDNSSGQHGPKHMQLWRLYCNRLSSRPPWQPKSWLPQQTTQGDPTRHLQHA